MKPKIVNLYLLSILMILSSCSSSKKIDEATENKEIIEKLNNSEFNRCKKALLYFKDFADLKRDFSKICSTDVFTKTNRNWKITNIFGTTGIHKLLSHNLNKQDYDGYYCLEYDGDSIMCRAFFTIKGDFLNKHNFLESLSLADYCEEPISTSVR